MKIALASDLHLEFADINLSNTEQADVLVLSGDIVLAEVLHNNPRVVLDDQFLDKHAYKRSLAYQFRSFFDRVSQEFPHVVYVAGNHEFYNSKWCKTIDYLTEEYSAYPNVYYLEDQTKVIDDCTFIGCTLWTDLNKGDPLTMHCVRDMMNDFEIIRDDSQGYTKLKPASTAYRHKRSLDYIKSVVAEKHEEKFVVCTHHAPTMQSIHPMYLHDKLMNGAYASDLSEFILDRPQIKLWTHGHTHTPFDYMVGDTRVVCNPRGYAGGEARAMEFELVYVDV